MKKFITGLTIGLVLGTVLSVFGAQIVGYNGYLHGWTVTKNGEEDGATFGYHVITKNGKILHQHFVGGSPIELGKWFFK